MKIYNKFSSKYSYCPAVSKHTFSRASSPVVWQNYIVEQGPAFDIGGGGEGLENKL